MAVNVLCRLEDQFSADLVARVASAIGEDAGATRRAIDEALAAILDMITLRASSEAGASALFEVLQESGLDGTRLGSVAQKFDNEAATVELWRLGGPIMAYLFSTQHGPAIARLSSLTGIKASAAESLCRMLAPLVVDFVAKATTWSGGFHPQALAALLAGQAAFVRPRPYADTGTQRL